MGCRPGGLSGLLAVILFLAVSAWCFGSQAGAARPQQPLIPLEISMYAKAKFIVDFSTEDLRHAYPAELSNLQFEDDPARLETLLKKVGENVELFFRDFPNTASKELVRRERLSPSGKVEDSVTQSFYYSVQSDKEASTWIEGRTDSRGNLLRNDPMRGVSFLTAGFANHGILFHSGHQVGSRFRYLGRDPSASNACVIAFSQRPEVGDFLGEFRASETGTAALILYQGLAWVDPETNQIIRMRTDLLSPRPDVMLARESTEIWFHEVRFATVARSFWMPREVLVNIEWNDRHFRNRHRYSDYLVFSVESHDKIELPKTKKKQAFSLSPPELQPRITRSPSIS